jgi:hypothetical protein
MNYTVSSSVSTDSSLPLKKCWSVGNVIVVAIAEEIVKRFGITGDTTYVQQEVTDDGILLRPVKQYVKEGEM